VKHIIGNRRALYRVIIENNEIVDMAEISKRCCIKEQVMVHGELKIVDKFDLSL
jgi:UDP-3-O-[3-hydroxymyristoyl] glucosamine N-acyltransferase